MKNPAPSTSHQPTTQQQLELIINHAGEGIYGIDMDGHTIFVNNAAAQMVGLSMSGMTNISNHDVVHHHYPDGRPYPIEACPIYATLNDGQPRHGDDEYFWRSDGTCFPIEYFVSPIFDKGQQTGAVITFIDITERKKLEQELDSYRNNLEELVREKNQELATANQRLLELSRLDGLTKIANRRAFDETLNKEIRRTNRTQQSCGLVIMDIDHFKLFNDHYGHPEGDHCLTRVAQQLQSLFPRAGNLVARYGGEEFALILPYTDPQDLIAQTTRIIEGVRELKIPHEKSKCNDIVTISVGATLGYAPIKDAETLISEADQALYQAKDTGRNRSHIYAP
ncbi:MAG: hypothetical protein CL693_04550 [Cellvibrionaceae bacterium]|nr:hypothetical protein [Cellvibrionaceae bacterium]|tara:strand:+ start:989 stop:2002 length:1014 start_codon:yes stop_codon:yes gene_type:complete